MKEMNGETIADILGNKSFILTEIKEVTIGYGGIWVTGSMTDYEHVKHEFGLLIKHKVTLESYKVESLETEVAKE